MASTLRPDEVEQIKQLTKLTDDAEAIHEAARGFLRIRKLQELKSISGKVEFDENWQALEELEISESDFPQ